MDVLTRNKFEARGLAFGGVCIFAATYALLYYLKLAIGLIPILHIQGAMSNFIIFSAVVGVCSLFIPLIAFAFYRFPEMARFNYYEYQAEYHFDEAMKLKRKHFKQAIKENRQAEEIAAIYKDGSDA